MVAICIVKGPRSGPSIVKEVKEDKKRILLNSSNPSVKTLKKGKKGN